MTVQRALALALQHHQAGRLAEAERVCREILAHEPNHAPSFHVLGVIAHQNRRHDEAAALIERAVALDPKAAEPHRNLGIVLSAIGQHDRAIAAYRMAIALQPDSPDVFYNLGITLKDCGQLHDAIAAFRQAIALQPCYVEAMINLGNALQNQGESDQAIATYRQAISLRPDHAEAHHNLAIALADKGEIEEAISAARQAVALRPDHAEAHLNLGNTLKNQGQLDQAIDAFRQALLVRPHYAEACNNLANALKDQGRLDEAIAACRQAVAIKPDSHRLHSNLIYTLHFDPAGSAEQLAQEHRRWNQQHAKPLQNAAIASSTSIQQFNARNRDPKRQLKIGYVSPDFRNHVVGRSLLPLLSHHDHAQFEIICYASAAHSDEMTLEFRKHCDGWRDIARLSDEQAAHRIAEDEIDVLVDLTLHMADNRLLVFARKPAPVQVTYLGYCGSTGMDAMDYRLSDPFLDPPGTDLSVYAERTICLQPSYWCYQPPKNSPGPSPLPARSAGVITFGCLNNFCKVSPSALDAWATILRQIPQSRLVLHAHHGSHRQQTFDFFARFGIEASRIEFVAAQPYAEHLRTYHQIDVTLDPFPYAGGITSLDSLWMGVPFVTLAGNQPVGRGGCSILSNIALPELIAHDHEQYISKTLHLAGDLPRLQHLRQSLRATMEHSPLMDAPTFAQNVEAAYRQMWRLWSEKH